MEQDLAQIEQFLDALWLERNLAENTLSAYRRDLTMVVEWLHHRGLSLASVSGEDLQSLLAERQTGGYKATSTARLLSLPGENSPGRSQRAAGLAKAAAEAAEGSERGAGGTPAPGAAG